MDMSIGAAANRQLIGGRALRLTARRESPDARRGASVALFLEELGVFLNW